MAAVPLLPVDIGSHRMSSRSGTSARQTPPRQLSRSKFNQSESQPSLSETTRKNSKPQPQQHSASYESSDDESLVPMKLSALTKALLNAEQFVPGAEFSIPDEGPASQSAQTSPWVYERHSAPNTSISYISKDRGNLREIRRNTQQVPPVKPTPPAASQDRGASPAPRMRVVRLSRTPGPRTSQNELRRSMSTSTLGTRTERRKITTERESSFQTQAEMDERQPNREDAQTSINTPVPFKPTPRFSVGSSGRRIGSAGSSAVTSKDFGADSAVTTPAKPATAEQTYAAADNVGSVSRGDNSGKREDLELRSTARSQRVISFSGSLLGGPARRGRRRQAEEVVEAYEEELVNTDQDPESQEAIDQPATALPTPKHPISTALGSALQGKPPISPARDKRAFLAPVSDTHAQRPASNSELQDHEPVLLTEITSVRAKEFQSSTPANHRRTSTKICNEEFSIPASPVSLKTESFAPQPAPIALERRALAVKGQNTPFLSASTPPPPKMSVIGTLPATPSIKKKRFMMRVNGRNYARIDCIGRGGSGKVYRVATASGVVLALKRVSLLHMDESIEKGLRGEIELLQRLRGVERVVQLIDYEMNREKESLSVLMELGELDFNSLLRNRQSEAETPIYSFDIAFVRHYWKEMLECVRAIHERAVVHSDLKPANFVLVKGSLKLIDFGIANAIQTDVTVNVHRESMCGTVNYMSPESLMDSTQYAFMVMQNGYPYIPANGASRVVKVGKLSDVWSLGCILYQMVYGLPPFGKISDHRSRIPTIVNWSHPIEFPATTEDGSRVPVALLQTMRRCLSRDQTDRPTCETLLSEDDTFLNPSEYDGLPVTEELLGRIIHSFGMRCKEGFPADNYAMATWTKAYWRAIEKAVQQPKPCS